MKPIEAKQLSDYPEFVKINGAVQKLQSEKAEVLARIDEISVALSQPKRPQDGGDAWAMVLAGQDNHDGHATDNSRERLREEQLELEGRVRFLDEALTVGSLELDKIHGQASLEACRSIRKEWIAHVRQVLEHLKGLCEANESLDRMRNELEEQNIRTDSLPYSKYDIGIWNDPYGGKLVGFRKFVSENYPELMAAAGMEIETKRIALAKREQAFEEKGAV